MVGMGWVGSYYSLVSINVVKRFSHTWMRLQFEYKCCLGYGSMKELWELGVCLAEQLPSQNEDED